MARPRRQGGHKAKKKKKTHLTGCTRGKATTTEWGAALYCI